MELRERVAKEIQRWFESDEGGGHTESFTQEAERIISLVKERDATSLTRAEQKSADVLLAEEEYRLRAYLAISHQDGKCHCYTDDGELQCANLGRHGRTIDFRREPISDLLDVIETTRMKEYAGSRTQDAPLREALQAMVDLVDAAREDGVLIHVPDSVRTLLSRSSPAVSVRGEAVPVADFDRDCNHCPEQKDDRIECATTDAAPCIIQRGFDPPRRWKCLKCKRRVRGDKLDARYTGPGTKGELWHWPNGRWCGPVEELKP